jgi:hypothetical protein
MVLVCEVAAPLTRLQVCWLAIAFGTAGALPGGTGFEEAWEKALADT